MSITNVFFYFLLPFQLLGCSNHLFWEHLPLFTLSSQLWLQRPSATNLQQIISCLSKLLLCSSKLQQLLQQQHYSRSVSVKVSYFILSLWHFNQVFISSLTSSVTDQYSAPAVSAAAAAATTATSPATPTTATVQCTSSGGQKAFCVTLWM